MERQELMFTSSGDPGQVFAALSAGFVVQADPATRSSWTCLDTADWRLHRAGMTLRDARRGRDGRLVLSVDRTQRLSGPAGSRRWPQRLDALPPSSVRDRIMRAVGVRALLPLAEVDVHSIPLRLLDDEDKIRVRVRVDQQGLVGSSRRPLPLRVLVSPLRGYERDARRCAHLLTEVMTQVDPQLAPATVAMTAAGHLPGQPSVPALTLDPAAPAAESLARVLRRWVDIIEAAVPGVVDDLDPEYLHDLRTSVRAARSMLSLSGHLLPGEHAARFAAEAEWLGDLTSPLRDLDVYLLELSGGGAVGAAELEDLEPLRRHLQDRRRAALRAVRAGLRSGRGRRLAADWRHGLDLVITHEQGGPSTVSVAATQVATAYRRIGKAAAPVTGETPPDELHRLRRRCKRMRYLVQGYESVCEPGAYREVVKRLARLQDCLGEVQDSDVQRRDLAEIAATLTRRGAPVRTVLAMGALRERTAGRDAAARQALTRELARFASGDTAARVRALVPAPS